VNGLPVVRANDGFLVVVVSCAGTAPVVPKVNGSEDHSLPSILMKLQKVISLNSSISI
jgi:hypothetical protein